MRACANCVLLCTTRESARLWEETGLFNLRLSSDAPNLQVENEETIEALSARTKALLDRIQQRFSFARSLYAFAGRIADATLRSARRVGAASSLGLYGNAFSSAVSVFLTFSFPFSFRFSCGARALPERMRSATIRGVVLVPGRDRSENPFPTTNDFSRPMSRQ